MFCTNCKWPLLSYYNYKGFRCKVQESVFDGSAEKYNSQDIESCNIKACFRVYSSKTGFIVMCLYLARPV